MARHIKLNSIISLLRIREFEIWAWLQVHAACRYDGLGICSLHERRKIAAGGVGPAPARTQWSERPGARAPGAPESCNCTQASRMIQVDDPGRPEAGCGPLRSPVEGGSARVPRRGDRSIAGSVFSRCLGRPGSAGAGALPRLAGRHFRSETRGPPFRSAHRCSAGPPAPAAP